jgi:hypothetical protein
VPRLCFGASRAPLHQPCKRSPRACRRACVPILCAVVSAWCHVYCFFIDLFCATLFSALHVQILRTQPLQVCSPTSQRHRSSCSLPLRRKTLSASGNSHFAPATAANTDRRAPGVAADRLGSMKQPIIVHRAQVSHAGQDKVSNANNTVLYRYTVRKGLAEPRRGMVKGRRGSISEHAILFM